MQAIGTPIKFTKSLEKNLQFLESQDFMLILVLIEATIEHGEVSGI
jgi:hypothetical protein